MATPTCKNCEFSTIQKIIFFFFKSKSQYNFYFISYTNYLELNTITIWSDKRKIVSLL